MKNRALTYLRTALERPDADFRAGQWECIEGVMRRQRQLVVEKTGWGKSMVYFLGTRLLRDEGAGFTLLISPLLSLMRNQIAAAERIGIRAETINSTNQEASQLPQTEIARATDAAILRAHDIQSKCGFYRPKSNEHRESGACRSIRNVGAVLDGHGKCCEIAWKKCAAGWNRRLYFLGCKEVLRRTRAETTGAACDNSR